MFEIGGMFGKFLGVVQSPKPPITKKKRWLVYWKYIPQSGFTDFQGVCWKSLRIKPSKVMFTPRKRDMNLANLLGIMNPPELLLMVQKSCVHQLRLVVYPIIYRFFLHPGWFLPSTVWTQNQLEVNMCFFEARFLSHAICSSPCAKVICGVVLINLSGWTKPFLGNAQKSWRGSAGASLFLCGLKGDLSKKKTSGIAKKSRWGQRSLKELSSRFRYCIDFYQKIIDLDY